MNKSRAAVPRQALVFAAGLGTRLYPLTQHTPKALVKVAGKPMLGHVLDALYAQGVEYIVVNVHHFAEQVIAYLAQHYAPHQYCVSDERAEVLETGGGLQRAAPYFTSGPILLYNVDVLADIDLAALLAYHTQKKALATLAVQTRVTSRYLLFDSASQLCGWMHADKQLFRAARPSSEALVPWAFCGIHIVDYRLLALLHVGKYSITESYLKLARTHTICAYPYSGPWLDIGKPERLAQAPALLRQL